MKDALFAAGYVLLIAFGLPITRVPFVSRLDRAARLAIAFATGALVVTMLMFLESLLHVAWSRVALGGPMLLIGAAAYARRRGGTPEYLGEPRSTSEYLGVPRSTSGSSSSPPRYSEVLRGSPRYFVIALTLILLATLYGVLTARETCADLFLFWGPKAQRFHLNGRIDLPFLQFRHYALMHPDYPPLLPEVYAWCALVAHRFSWWGCLLSLPVAIAAATLAFRGIARDALGSIAANRHATFMATLLAATFAISMTAGGADPMLVVFELIAVASLTFAPDDRGAQFVAALALAGAALTKVEGAAFAAVVLAAFAVTRRRIAAAALMAIPPILLLGAWIAFARRNQLFESYTLGKNPIYWKLLGGVLRKTVKEAGYDLAGLPWLAPLAVVAMGRNWRRAAFPLLVAAGVFAYTIFFYLHIEDPQWWIESSAERVLITAVMCFGVAAAAAEPDPRLVTAPASE